MRSREGNPSAWIKQPWKTPDFLFAGWLLLWLTFNWLTLTDFPRIHSDEAWLAGLSNAMGASRSLTVTEPFFDLFPRQPHAFKMLFHTIQALAIGWLGFSVQTVRLLSLTGGAVALNLLYRSWRRLTETGWLALGLAILFSIQPIFLITSHLARQESLLFAVLAGLGLQLAHLSADPEGAQDRRLFWMTVCAGLAALIHPNALMVAAMVGLPLLIDGLASRLAWHQFIRPGLVLLAIGIALISLSIAVSPGFLSQYADFGANLAVDAAPAQRLQHFQQFFSQLWRQDTGTYEMPDLRWLMVAFALLATLAAGLLALPGFALANAERRGLEQGLASSLGFLLALFAIGRYNPTSIVFVLWPGFQLLAWIGTIFCRHLKKARFEKGLALILVLIGLVPSLGALNRLAEPIQRPSAADPYATYSSEIVSHLPGNAVILGNLSAGFGLTEAGFPFYDIRNLPYAKDPAGYLRQNEITVIIWYEEYDYILRNPDWWVLYEIRPGRTADPAALASLKAIIESQGILIHTFESPQYGTRVTAFQDGYPWRVSLVEIDPASLS